MHDRSVRESPAKPAAAIALIVLARPSAAQTTSSAPAPEPAAKETLATPWSFSATAYADLPARVLGVREPESHGGLRMASS